jgi:quinol monooxygenase YgiN
MIRISLMLVAPRGGFERLASTLRQLMAQARAVEGCVNCHVSGDLHDSDTLYYVEEWMSESELRRDIRSERFGRLLEGLELAARPPRVQVQVILESHGLDYIEAARRGRS